MARNMVGRVVVPCPKELTEALKLAARRQMQPVASYARAAILEKLAKDGICPTSIAA
jgi:hypothetical protein